MNYDQSDRDQEMYDWLNEDDEEIVGECPECHYPLVEEFGITLCYHCGWNNDPDV